MIALARPTRHRPPPQPEIVVRMVPAAAGAAERFDKALLKLMSWGAAAAPTTAKATS